MNKIVNKRNGIIAAIVVVLVVGAIIATTTFSQAMTLDEAKNVAKKYVPGTAEFVTSEEEETKFEVVFYDNTNKESFEAEVSKDTKQIKKLESQLDNDLGSKTVTLKKAEVKDIIKERFGNVTSVNVTLNKDNGLYEYGATFKSNDFYGDADVNPKTGAVLESTIKYGTAVTIPSDKNNSKDGLLTYEEVEKAVIKAAGGGSVKDMDLEKHNDEYYYEVELVKDNMEYDYYVNAKTGEVTLESKHESHLDYDDDDDDYYEDVTYPGQGSGSSGNNGSNSGGNTGNAGNSGNNSSNKISLEKAKSIVLAKLPGATISKIYLEMEDGIYVYEGEARLGNYEYDFEINASSGVIIGWEKDRIEYDDDHDDDWDDDDDEEWDD